MATGARAFAARVQLPCRVFYGPDSILELAGTAVSIDTGSLLLSLPAKALKAAKLAPEMGAQVRLELSLPVLGNGHKTPAKAKYLAFRARVAEVAPGSNGSLNITCRFRKGSFRDRAEGSFPAGLSSIPGWEM